MIQEGLPYGRGNFVKNIRKILCLALVLSFIAAPILLVSCQTDANKSDRDGAPDDSPANQSFEDGDEAAPNADDELKPDLPEGANYGGYELKILTRGDEGHAYPAHTRDIMAAEETGEPMNDAVYKRNGIVEDLLGVKITMIPMDESDESRPNNAVKTAFLAGDDLYDLLMTHMILGGPTAQNGYLKNWGSIPYVDLSQPWWCKSATENLSVGNKIFLALSDLSVSSSNYAFTCLFNKQMQQEWAAENLYDVVRAGKWTFDKMYSVTKDIKKDLNGDGQMTMDDLYGLLVAADVGTLNFFYAGGDTVTKKDADNVPYLDILTERSIEAFGKALGIVSAESTFFLTQWNQDNFMNMFSGSHGFIINTNVAMITEFRDMEIDFGILPYPKFDEKQDKYLEYVDGHAPLMGVPAMVQNDEKVGAIIEALSYYSYKYVVPAYYDINLKTKFARDDESAEMLDIIMEGRVFDFGYVYDNWVIAFQFQELLRAKKDTFVSTIEKNMSKAQKNLDAILAAYDSIE